MNGKNYSHLFSNPPPVRKPDDPPPADDAEDDGFDGPCAFAARAKDKWVTAITIQHPKGPWESFQYRHLAARSVFEPTAFWVRFVDDDATWRVAVRGRNLHRIYNLVIQRRMEWLRPADRDFAGDREPIITAISVEREEEKGA